MCLNVSAGCGDERPASWSYISPAIIQPNCATSSCHSRAAAAAGLDLSDATGGYRSLLDQRLPAGRPMANYLGKDPPRQLVSKGHPTQSRLLNMLRGIGANVMPPDRPLPGADIDLVEQWILEGAQP